MYRVHSTLPRIWIVGGSGHLRFSLTAMALNKYGPWLEICTSLATHFAFRNHALHRPIPAAYPGKPASWSAFYTHAVGKLQNQRPAEIDERLSEWVIISTERLYVRLVPSWRLNEVLPQSPGHFPHPSTTLMPD
jgi:hypothetical protein